MDVASVATAKADDLPSNAFRFIVTREQVRLTSRGTVLPVRVLDGRAATAPATLRGGLGTVLAATRLRGCTVDLNEYDLLVDLRVGVDVGAELVAEAAGTEPEPR